MSRKSSGVIKATGLLIVFWPTTHTLFELLTICDDISLKMVHPPEDGEVRTVN
jgi:hypothetical protein